MSSSDNSETAKNPAHNGSPSARKRKAYHPKKAPSSADGKVAKRPVEYYSTISENGKKRAVMMKVTPRTSKNHRKKKQDLSDKDSSSAEAGGKMTDSENHQNRSNDVHEKIYFELTKRTDVWSTLIKPHLPCIRYNSSKKCYQILDTTATTDAVVLKEVKGPSPEPLMRFMLLHGIPGADGMTKEARQELTDEIVMYHVPKNDLNSARHNLDDMSKSDTEILPDQDIIDFLSFLGFTWTLIGNKWRIYLPGAWDYLKQTAAPGIEGEHYFATLQDVRVYVRSHADLQYASRRVRASRKDALMLRKKNLLLRVWAASSPEPLPEFDWSKWRSRCTNNDNVATGNNQESGRAASSGNGGVTSSIEHEGDERGEEQDQKPSAIGEAASRQSCREAQTARSSPKTNIASRVSLEAPRVAEAAEFPNDNKANETNRSLGKSDGDHDSYVGDMSTEQLMARNKACIARNKVLEELVELERKRRSSEAALNEIVKAQNTLKKHRTKLQQESNKLEAEQNEELKTGIELRKKREKLLCELRAFEIDD